MPRRFTVLQLETRVRTVTDSDNDGHVTSAFIRQELSTAYGTLWGTVSETGYRYFETLEALVTDGSDALDEPSLHFSTVGLDRVLSDGTRYELQEIMIQERNLVRTTSRADGAYWFAFIDDQIKLFPTPPAGQTYELLYIPQSPDLTAAVDADVVDVVTPDGEAFLIHQVAAIVKMRQDKDPSFHLGLAGSTEREGTAMARLSRWATMRSLTQPRRNITSPVGVYEEGDYLDRRGGP